MPSFLSEAEKQTIAARLAAERPAAPPSLWPGLYDPRVLLLGLAGTGIGAGIFGSQLWLPQIVKAMGYSNLTTGFIVGAAVYASAIAHHDAGGPLQRPAGRTRLAYRHTLAGGGQRIRHRGGGAKPLCGDGGAGRRRLRD